MRFVTLRCCFAVFATLVSSTFATADSTSVLTAQEAAKGFQALFNGSNLDGWKHSGNWEVVDGDIARKGKGGSLVYNTKKIPDDFELRFDWKVGKGSNSGVYYRPSQYEYQILDNAVHKDGKNYRTSAASLYFCMPPSEDVTKPAGQWNQGRIVCKGSVVQHWLNGKKVVGFDYKDPQWKTNVDMLKQRGGNLEARGAFLSLQDHGDPVWYRNIRMREIAADEKIDESPVTPATLTDEMIQAERKKLDGIIARREAARKKATEEKAKAN